MDEYKTCNTASFHSHLILDALDKTSDSESVCGGAAQRHRLEGLVAVGAATAVVDAETVQITGGHRWPRFEQIIFHFHMNHRR